MPAGHGLRSRTRDLFSRGFRKKGYIPLTTYLRTYKVGDYVDVKVNGAIHKARGEVISTKRQPQGPKPGFMVEGATLETVTPIPYDVTNDLKGGY
ncbi:60S ribosomal protein L21-1 [Linum perenne]